MSQAIISWQPSEYNIRMFQQCKKRAYLNNHIIDSSSPYDSLKSLCLNKCSSIFSDSQLNCIPEELRPAIHYYRWLTDHKLRLEELTTEHFNIVIIRIAYRIMDWILFNNNILDTSKKTCFRFEISNEKFHSLYEKSLSNDINRITSDYTFYIKLIKKAADFLKEKEWLKSVKITQYIHNILKCPEMQVTIKINYDVKKDKNDQFYAFIGFDETAYPDPYLCAEAVAQRIKEASFPLCDEFLKDLSKQDWRDFYNIVVEDNAEN